MLSLPVCLRAFLLLVLLGAVGPLPAEKVFFSEIAVAPSNRLLRRDAQDHPHIGAGISWNELGFDASSWQSGAGPFGFGFGGINTRTDSQMLTTTPSLYVRREFEVSAAQAANLGSLTLLINYNDGLVLYLNGVELLRRNLGPTNLYVFSDQTAFNSRSALLSENILLASAATLLKPGKNVIAAQVHNTFPSSDFFGFDADFFFYADLTLASSPAQSLVRNNDIWRYSIGLTEPSGGLFDAELAASDASLARFSDWVEIQNAEAVPVNLKGWSLTDDPSKPMKWIFPDLQIPAGGYRVLFCSGLDRRDSAHPLHTNFELDPGGHYLGLYDPNAAVISEFKQLYPAQSLFHSYGLDAASGRYVYFSTPSPGQANRGETLAAIVEPPTPSLPAGFYDQAVSLFLQSTTLGATTRYTLDGTEPTENHGEDFTGTIALSTNAVIRARCFRSGWIPSKVTTATYLLGQPSALRSLPALMLGADPGRALYSPQGITTIHGGSYSFEVWSANNSSDYNMALLYGGASERPTSLEILRPADGMYRQIDCGVQLSGSRWSRPRMILSGIESGPWKSYWAYKPSLSFYFRNDYGAGKLQAPLFPGSTSSSFNELRLRAGKNDYLNPFVRDETVRRLWLDMGQLGSHGILCNLWVNSEFKGFFNLVERLHEAFFQSSYGSTNHWDVRLVDESRDGDSVRWGQDMSYIWQHSFTDSTNYAEAGRRFDLVNLADYCLLNAYCAMWDWPENNFYMVRERAEAGIWRFHAWDAEGAFGLYTTKPVDYNSITNDLLFAAPVSTNAYRTLSTLITSFSKNPEFRLLVADRVQKHFFHGGALTATNVLDHYARLKTELDPVMQYVFKQSVIDSYMAPWTLQRPGILLSNLHSAGLWPATAAPEFSLPGGQILPGTTVSLGNTPGGDKVYYTLDGSDPRAVGGAAAGLLYDLPIAITTPGTLRARVLRGGEWSPISEAAFAFPPPPSLAITEINYDPTPFESLDGQPFEFVEIQNQGTETAYLAGVAFTGGIDFAFPISATLEPGAFAVIAKDAAAFASRYSAVTAAGQYSGKLDNNGERLTLSYYSTNVLFSVHYDDNSPWPKGPAGLGFTLVPSQGASSDPDSPGYWRSSASLDGSPGAADAALTLSPVVINEILPRSGLASGWQLELYNPTSTAVDLSGWLISDGTVDVTPYRLPGGTLIAASGFLTLDQQQVSQGSPTSANLVRPTGGRLSLLSGDRAGNLTGYTHTMDYPPTPQGVSIGRLLLSTGEETFTPMTASTLGARNSAPRFGPVLITEIQYQPTPGNYEFIELANTGTTEVSLYDASLASGWRVSGIGYTFSVGTVLAPDEIILITEVDPMTFRVKYDVPASVRIFGPWDGGLQSGGERVTLEMPLTIAGATVYTVKDTVRYADHEPWPLEAVGLGGSLQRASPDAFGDEPLSWRGVTPSPGKVNYLGSNTEKTPDLRTAGELGFLPLGQSLVLTALISSEAPRPEQIEIYADGLLLGRDTLPPYQLTWTPSRAGTYQLRARSVYGDERYDSSPLSFRVLNVQSTNLTLIPAGSIWKYLDDGVDQSNRWWGLTFDDSAWGSGPAQLGYGEGDEKTLLRYGPDPANKHITAYFRLRFVSPGVSVGTNGLISFLRDDGGIIYLNGKRVVTSNMPDEPITFGTLAGGNSGAENIFIPYPLSSSDLIAGTNQVAVEVHQNQAASSDLSFDLQLTATFLEMEPWIVSQPMSQEATAGTSVSLRVLTAGQPLIYQWYRTGIGSIANANTFDLKLSDLDPSQAGNYYVIVSNALGSVTSATARLSVIAPDSDNDGIPNYWEARYGMNPSNGSDANEDLDGDGLTNLEEYLRGFNPSVPDLALKLIPITEGVAVVALKLSFLGLAGSEYSVEHRTSMASSWQALYHFESQPIDHRVEVQFPASNEARFYRVVKP